MTKPLTLRAIRRRVERRTPIRLSLRIRRITIEFEGEGAPPRKRAPKAKRHHG